MLHSKLTLVKGETYSRENTYSKIERIGNKDFSKTARILNKEFEKSDSFILSHSFWCITKYVYQNSRFVWVNKYGGLGNADNERRSRYSKYCVLSGRGIN